MVDPKAGLRIHPGCQHVDGITALAYARSRHSDPALGDITRAKHQREVVSAIGDRVKSPWSVLNPFRYSGLINAATDSLKVSDGTGVIDMAKFARAMTQVNGKSGLTCSMPIRDLAVHWDRDRALALMRRIKTDKTDHIPRNLCSPTGLTS
jgi:anionic cell wall polymer biosynthesis LytR-Cps2A-Psr (LCP) family protein